MIVLGFDGFARRYLDTDSAPALHALARTGVAAHGMIPSFPTITFPNFYALATGLYPDHSGIVNNRFFDPAFDSAFEYKKPVAHESHWWGGEPIWVTATKQGAPAATMFWVGSDAAVSGVHPELWHSYDRAIQFGARVDTMLAWLDLPAPARPRLVMGYFEEPDTQGHRHGPDSPETHEAVLRVDSALAQLVSGLRSRRLYDSVDIIIVADHGMAQISPDKVIYLDDVVDSASVNVVTLSPNLSISARDNDNDALLARLKKLPHVTAWKKSDVPARLHYGTNARVTADRRGDRSRMDDRVAAREGARPSRRARLRQREPRHARALPRARAGLQARHHHRRLSERRRLRPAGAAARHHPGAQRRNARALPAGASVGLSGERQDPP